jgi:hypothetical protein
MSILANVSFHAGTAAEFDAEKLQQLLVHVGEYRGVLRTLGNTDRFLPMLALIEAYHALESEVSFDELLWYSSAETGKQKDAGFDNIIRWRDAYLSLWMSLRMRPMLNTSILQKFMASALGRNKQVRKSADAKVSVSDRMKQVDVFLNLDSTYPVAIRSLMAADAIRRIKPFHDDGDPLVKLLPGLLIAIEYELPLPLLGYSKSRITHNNTVDDHLMALNGGVTTVLDLILELRDARNETFDRAMDLLPARMQSGELFDLIYARPVVKVRDLVEAGIVKRQTAAEYLKALEDVRILQSRAIGREMMYRNEDVVGIIEHCRLKIEN